MTKFFINLTIALVVIISVCGMYLEANAKTEWTKETQKKLDLLIKIGFEPLFAKSLIEECKSTAKNPVKCIKIGASIAGAESSMAYRCYKFNCLGLGGGSFHYSNTKKGVKDWIKRYNKYWYKQTSPNGFYPLKGKVSPTRYCTSEVSSGSKKGCPNGNKNAWSVWNKITF